MANIVAKDLEQFVELSAPCPCTVYVQNNGGTFTVASVPLDVLMEGISQEELDAIRERIPGLVEVEALAKF